VLAEIPDCQLCGRSAARLFAYTFGYVGQGYFINVIPVATLFEIWGSYFSRNFTEMCLPTKVSRKVEEAADSDLGAKVEKTAEKAGSKLEKASNNVQVNSAMTAVVGFGAGWGGVGWGGVGWGGVGWGGQRTILP